ncbi:hypothetical protein ACH42_11430 [Endozoicomonas sp. (ex Bugula neritina AB1)]|nr:hypothetical protein ACH42_11430 [Endozoicomonas sp. (ex Bugula neritina AB1)]
MPPKLLLIDALNLIRRIHAAVKAPDENAQVDGALSATLSSLMRALKHTQPTHVLVVFDGDPPTWRHKLLPEYKSHRKPMPVELRNQLTDFNRLFRQNGIMTFRRNGVEADDVIGAIAHKAIQANIQTTILSTDKIYRQLLGSPLITVRDHFNKVDHQKEDVIREFEVPPEKLLDLWAMAGIGDVPGVSGVGDKGALKLLQEQGVLEQIISFEGESKGALMKVLQQKEQAILSKKLATLLEDIELGISLKDMRYSGMRT